MHICKSVCECMCTAEVSKQVFTFESGLSVVYVEIHGVSI